MRQAGRGWESFWCVKDSLTKTDHLGTLCARPFVYLLLSGICFMSFTWWWGFVLWKLKQFLTSERGLQDFHELASCLHTFHSLRPCLSLPLPAGVCQSWVPDAKWFSQCSSPSWTCYWLALPKSNGIADRCCKTPPTCSGSKFSYSVCAWAGTRGFLMCSPILITAVSSKGRGMASFIANSCFLSSNCVCGSVQPQRGFWQLAGAAAFTLLSCDN